MSAGDAEPQPRVKLMKLRYAGRCECGNEVLAGTKAGYDRVAKSVVCPDCIATEAAVVQGPVVEGPAPESETEPESVAAPERQAPQEIDIGAAGASLRREYERRRATREKQIRAKHKRLGGLILALSDEPPTTRAFATGADGEERLAARFEADCTPDVLFLHNRKLGIGRRDGDIDHVAIAPSGIYLIDAKRYPNSKVRIERSGGLFSPVKHQLMVGGRDRSKLLEGCAKQVAALNVALSGHPLAERICIVSVLCFIDADLPMFGSMEINGVRLLGPRATIKAITTAGGLDQEAKTSLHRHLARALPSA